MNDEQHKPSIHIGGNVTGQNVVIGGSQTIHGNLSITVGAMPAAPEDVRETLKQQIAELIAELEAQPAEQTSDVKRIRMAANDAVKEAEQPQPDKENLQIRGEALMEAAKNLAKVAPIAVGIAKTLLMIG